MYSRSVAHAPRIFCRAAVPWGGVVPKVSVDAAAGAGRIKVRGATSSDCVANFARSQHRHAASTFCSYLKMPRLRNWLTPSRAQVHDFAPQVCEHMVSGCGQGFVLRDKNRIHSQCLEFDTQDTGPAYIRMRLTLARGPLIHTSKLEGCFM